MDDLRIEDNDADAFVLRDGDDVVLEMDGDVTAVELSDSDAIRMVNWLRERFGMLAVARGFDTVTITVPGAAGGAPREVSWKGDGDAPDWLSYLAATALGTTANARTVTRDVYDEMRERNERNYAGWRDLITALGASTPEGAHERVRLLTDLGRYRKVLEVLGAETPEVAAEIAQTWRTWLDEAGRILIGQGVADATAQNAIDPVKALNTLLNRHAAGLKTQTQYWAERERQMRAESLSATGSAVAKEREARAAAHVELDRLREGQSKTEAKHADAIRLNERLLERLAVARDALEAVRGEFYDMDERVSRTDMSGEVYPLIVAKLDKALRDSA